MGVSIPGAATCMASWGIHIMLGRSALYIAAIQSLKVSYDVPDEACRLLPVRVSFIIMLHLAVELLVCVACIVSVMNHHCFLSRAHQS